MALRWRIRHKLLLGLGVVVAVMGLLLVGSLQGLAAFTATVNTADSKLAEIDCAESLLREIAAIRRPVEPNQDLNDEAAKLRPRLKKAQEALVFYRDRLQDTIDRGRDLDPGGHGQRLVKDLEVGFAKLDDALKDAAEKPLFNGPGEGGKLGDVAAVKSAVDKLEHLANLLRYNIYQDLYKRISVAKQEHRRSLWVVLTTSIVGVLLMAGLLRFFYGWLFHPLRDLQAGVSRVARGDFAQPIELTSSDELQELASAFNDMTDRLKSAYNDLVMQVNERGKQLVRSERLASVGFLAAGVAHEINNPLASIAFCAEGLERRLSDLLGRFPREHETIAKYLKMIQTEAFRCKTITQGLLEFSRVGEGERLPTDLGEVLQSVLDMVQHHPKAQGKRIVFRPTARPVAMANPQELKQVALNVIVNALDSMDAGGTLTVEIRQRGRAAELAFTDTGCGMEPAVLDKIFEPFFTQSRVGKGTGLGLSISHKIVSQHGGEIEATSPGPGRGSTFLVRLPLQQPALKEEPLGHSAAA